MSAKVKTAGKTAIGGARCAAIERNNAAFQKNLKFALAIAATLVISFAPFSTNGGKSPSENLITETQSDFPLVAGLRPCATSTLFQAGFSIA